MQFATVPHEQKELKAFRLRNWIIVLCIWLGLVSGGTSFYCRIIHVEQAAASQRMIWNAFLHQETPQQSQRSKRELLAVNRPRILMPAVMAGVVTVTHLPWAYAFSLVRLMTIIIAYLLFYWYLRRWFNQAQALLGLLFMVATIPLTFVTIWSEIPTDYPEIITYILAIWFIHERKYLPLCAIIAVGTCNRETTIFLPLILLSCLLGNVSTRELMGAVASAAVSWLVPFVLLRWLTGGGMPGDYGNSLTHNSQGLALLVSHPSLYNQHLFYIYLYGPLWLLPFVGWSHLTMFFRRVVITVPALLVVYLFFGGFLNEPREIVNLYPLLVPASLAVLFGGTRDETKPILPTEIP